MKEISIQEFIDTYKPICNDKSPFPNGLLKERLGNIIWDRREYRRMGNHINRKQIWTVFKVSDWLDMCEKPHKVFSLCDKYVIVATVNVAWANVTGYILCDVPYHTNDVSNLMVIVSETGQGKYEG